jgi:hypothetical protein
MGLLESKWRGLLDYIEANTPRATRPRTSPAQVFNEGLVNPNEYNAPAANRFKDSAFGLLGGIPGADAPVGFTQGADYFNRGEPLAGSVSVASGILPFIPPTAASLFAMNKVAQKIGTPLPAGPARNQAGAIVYQDGLLGEVDNVGMGYTVNSLGSLGHQIIKDGAVVGTVKTGKAKDAITAFLKQQDAAVMAKNARKEASNISTVARAARQKEIDALSIANTEYADVIASAHKNKNLEFKPLPDGISGLKGNPQIHRSPSYGKKPGSSYELVMVDGKPAYARTSDHWGQFFTNDFINGEQVSSSYNWPLAGVETKPYGDIRRSGYVLLDDLLKK